VKRGKDEEVNEQGGKEGCPGPTGGYEAPIFSMNSITVISSSSSIAITTNIVIAIKCVAYGEADAEMLILAV